MPLSNWDRKNLHLLMASPELDSFTARLLQLIRFADRRNAELLRQVFPEEVAAVEWWQTHRADEPFPGLEEVSDA